MMRKLKRRYGVAGAVCIAIAAAAGFGAAQDVTAAASQTFVFGAGADPVTLDAPFVNDGESGRVVNQIAQGLVAVAPNSTRIVPLLATSWKESNAGKTYTFTLRHGVDFTDGTPFNAQAVCYNFDRWYNFKGAQQSSDAADEYLTYFAGFKTGATAKEALYKSCTAPNPTTAVINLARPYGGFISICAVTELGIESPTALKKTGGGLGTVDKSGVYHPSGTFWEHPVGTGPFEFESWVRGAHLTLVRNPHYWGTEPYLKTLIFVPIADSAARLQALETGEIDGYDNADPTTLSTIAKNPKLKIVYRPAFDIGYVAITQTNKPLNNVLVRQAVAYGLDRSLVVQTLYAGLGQVATQFETPGLLGYNPNVTKYPYDPAKSKALLQKAGLKLPVTINFWYPSGVSRPYLPDPQRIFEAFAASLGTAGFNVVPRTAPWSPDYLDKVFGNGTTGLALIGDINDHADPDGFLNSIFLDNAEFGLPAHSPLVTALMKDVSTPNQQVRAKQYEQLNEQIMTTLPAIPFVYAKSALVFRSNVTGYAPNPTTNEYFTNVRFTS